MVKKETTHIPQQIMNTKTTEQKNWVALCYPHFSVLQIVYFHLHVLTLDVYAHTQCPA